jgi:type I restriction enzyme, S subunit
MVSATVTTKHALVAADRFQETEIGQIPYEWDVMRIGKVGNVIRGASPRPKGDKRYYGGDIPRLMVEDVTRDGKFVTPQVDFLTKDGAKLSRPCKAGTLTIVCSGTVGVPAFLSVDACIHDGFLAVIGIDARFDPDYLYHQINKLRTKLDSAATHGGVFTNLTTTGVKEFPIAIPRSKVEQKSIADALSNTDTLISSLEQIIEKKRQIKYGTMQQLLTPQHDWIELTLGASAQLKARIGWQGLTTSEYLDSGEYHLITGTEFFDGFIDWDNCHFVDKLRYDQDKYIQVRENDVLVTKDGTIGKVAFVDNLPRPATLNSGVFVIRPLANAFRPKFFYYLLMSPIFAEFLAKLSAGSTISHLYQKDFVKFSFFVPPTEQQQDSIASTLMDMDHDIQATEARLTQVRRIKHGMMQELLTGRVRLT